MTLDHQTVVSKRILSVAVGILLVGAFCSGSVEAQGSRVPAWALPVQGTGFDRATGLPQFVVDRATGIHMALIPAGQFVMGASPDDSEADADERPARLMTIARPFYMGRTEVTQAQFAMVARIRMDSVMQETANCPAEVDYNNVAAFCRATGFTLPSEAQWEYACRAGTRVSRYGPLDVVSNYYDHTIQRPVATRRANAFGLFDMLGNALEWTGSSYSQNQIVVRGGARFLSAQTCRASWRDTTAPTTQCGFRVIREL